MLSNLYRVREVVQADLFALSQIKPTYNLHQDRMQQSLLGCLSYLVVEDDIQVLGFGMLVYTWPSDWADSPGMDKLPMMIDLVVRVDARGKGVGSFMITSMEHITQAKGFDHIYLSVDPLTNPKALALYQRLGYRALQSEPYLERWSFTDSAGHLHEGEEWLIDMAKELK
jgi:ribosomal protein S18 acetylase RimI-like enzyme